MNKMDGGIRSRKYTRRMNEVGNHTTGLKIDEKFVGG
jgi:hypothetical protein